MRLPFLGIDKDWNIQKHWARDL